MPLQYRTRYASNSRGSRTWPLPLGAAGSSAMMSPSPTSPLYGVYSTSEGPAPPAAPCAAPLRSAPRSLRSRPCSASLAALGTRPARLPKRLVVVVAMDELGEKGYQKCILDDWAGAVAIWDEAIRRFPREKRFYNNRALCYFLRKEYMR